MGNGVAQEILRLAGEWVRAAERFKDGHGTQPMVHEAKQQFYSFVIHGGGIVGDSRRASETGAMEQR